MLKQMKISNEYHLQEKGVVRASVRLKEDWIDRLQMKCDVNRLLTEVARNQKCHLVEVVCNGGIWHLVGCACGVNGAREELMERKRALDNQSTEGEIYLRTRSDTCRDREEGSQVMLPEGSKGDIATCGEDRLASRENGKSYNAIDVTIGDDADKCYAEQSVGQSLRHSAQSEDTVKKDSQKTKESNEQNAKNCWSLEHKLQNPSGNNPNGFKDSDDGTNTKGTAKEDTKVRGQGQTDELSKVKIDANKEKDTAAAAVCWTQKQDSTQLTQQDNPPKASAGERGASDVYSSPDVQTTTNSDLEQRDRICGLLMLLNVAVDPHVFYFLFRKQNAELSAISERCSVFEPFDDGPCHKIAIAEKDGEDLVSIASAFDKLFLQVIKQVVWFPADVCFDGLEDNIKATTSQTENVDLYFDNDSKSCQMVGRKNDIDKLIQEIDKLLYANKGERFKASPDTQVKGHFDPTEPPPCTLHPPPPPPAGSPVFTLLSHDQCNMELLINSCDLIHLDLICEDVSIVCNADVLVTFVDHDLKPFGQFAEALAAHQSLSSLDQALADVRRERAQPFPTGSLVHTPANGPGTVKSFIHVVPPTEAEFPLKDPNTANALQSVFANCINYSNSTLETNSICIPSVGCGVYPCYLVARCFVEALLQFHQSIVDGRRIQHIRRIQLVNNDTRQMAELIDAMHRHLSNM